jgi:hypothetical protein
LKRIIVTIGLALLLFAGISAPFVHSEGVSKADWAESMNNIPIPGIGCWIASYPSLMWESTQCSTVQPGPLTVGNGVDKPADSINYAAADAEGIFTSESGFTSESDSVDGSNWYTLQLNSNNFSTTVGGKATTGWEQFAFLNKGAGSNTGIAFIQFWLIGYGTCPSGWTQYSTSCYRNSTPVTPGYEGPGSLTYYTLTGMTTSTTDTSKFCNTNAGLCYSSTDSDRVNLHSGVWWDSEFNILGAGSGSQANFNSGTSIGLKIDNFEPGESCGSIGWAAETNNLNLGTCSGSTTLQYITFSES